VKSDCRGSRPVAWKQWAIYGAIGVLLSRTPPFDAVFPVKDNPSEARTIAGPRQCAVPHTAAPKSNESRSALPRADFRHA
jgi:hypothetical protein